MQLECENELRAFSFEATMQKRDKIEHFFH